MEHSGKIEHPDKIITQTTFVRWCPKCESYRNTYLTVNLPEGVRRCLWCHTDLPTPPVAMPAPEEIVERIAVYIERDSECLMPIVVEETKRSYGVRMLKVLADEVRDKFKSAPPVAVTAPTEPDFCEDCEGTGTITTVVPCRTCVPKSQPENDGSICGAGKTPKGWWCTRALDHAGPCATIAASTEPSGATELPELDVNHPYYAEAGREWTTRVPKDFPWCPFEVRLIEERMQRERQLRDLLAKYVAALREIEILRGKK